MQNQNQQAMNKPFYFFFILLLTALNTTGQSTLTESSSQYNQRMQWWHDARFGMFIHWGAYAVPAGWHNGTELPGASEWIMETGSISPATYEQYPARFNPRNFNADAWVKTARDAGMKYLVITSKHHDGFCMWNSAISGYDVIDFAPYRHDPLKDLSKACKKYGIHFGLYHSIMDWHHPDASGPNFARYRDNYLIPQLEELIKNYDPEILWFDGEWIDEWTEEQGRQLYNHLRAIKPSLIINNRIGKGRNGMQGMNTTEDATGDFGTPEQEILTSTSAKAWEACMTMNDSWGFKKGDTNWKSTRQLVRNLVDIASKGGNYLLNVGPDSNGVIPHESVERLHQMGEWLAKNGKAVYGTVPAGMYGESEDTRICRSANGKHYYIIFFSYPQSTVSIRSLKPLAGTKARLLANNAAIEYSWDAAGGLSLTFPPFTAASGKYAWVAELEAEEVPVTKAPEFQVMTGEKGSEILFSRSAELRISSADTNAVIYYTNDGSTPGTGSKIYNRPVLISHSQGIRATGLVPGKSMSIANGITFTRIDMLEDVVNDTPLNERYAGKGKFTLFDGKTGTTGYTDKNWLGYESKDAVMTVNLGIVRKFTGLEVHYLSDQNSWIFAPASVEIEASVNGRDFIALGRTINTNPDAGKKKTTAAFSAAVAPVEARWLRIRVLNNGVCPAGHPGAGQPAWIFLDEIRLLLNE